MTDPPDRRAPKVVLTGWVVDYEAADRVPSARVVVVADGRVVPAGVTRFGLPHWDLQFGRRVPVGFAAAADRADLPAGAAVRVFAVAAGDPDRIKELVVPPAEWPEEK